MVLPTGVAERGRVVPPHARRDCQTCQGAPAHAIERERVVSDRNLAGVRACVFDAYGTLFDFASAAAGCADVLGDEAAVLTRLWRDKQLQYTWLRAAAGRHADFWAVTGDALDFVLEALHLRHPGLRERLMSLYLTLDAFPEVPAVLPALKARSCRTARRRC